MKNRQKEWQVKKEKIKLLGVSIFLAFTFSLSAAKAQTLYVNQSSGTQTDYSLNNIQKITFSSNTLTVTKADNSSEDYSLDALQYLSFTDYMGNTTTEVEAISKETISMKLYPNPVGSELNIKLPEAGTVKILSLDGKILLMQQVNTAGITTLNVDQLKIGIYVCLYSNGKETKTLKFIKQ